MKKTILLLTGLAFLTIENQAQTVTDIDGNVYQTVTIGNQVWMAENLRTSKYNDGSYIQKVINSTTWNNLSTGAFSWYNNDSALHEIPYGKLYNFYSVKTGNLCPSGWHVPTDAEWTTLTDSLGGLSISGGKLKEIGIMHWTSPNTGATNETGFTALPDGYRNIVGDFGLKGNGGYYWSSTEHTTNITVWYRVLRYNYNDVLVAGDGGLKNGFSVRCLNNSTSDINDIQLKDKIQIFPNPAVEKIIITHAEKQNVKMQIYNTLGDCMQKKILNNNTNEIDISSLSRGIYIIIFSGANWTVNRRITKL